MFIVNFVEHIVLTRWSSSQSVEKRRRKGPDCNNAQRTEVQEGGYVWRRRGHPAGSSGRPYSWTSIKECSDLRLVYGKWLDILEAPSSRNERRDVQGTALWKKDGGGTHGTPGTLSENCSGRAALRREQREQLESNHSENRATGMEGEADHKRHKHSPQKRRTGSTPVGYSRWIAIRQEQCGM
jgi:hypothetical protein